MKRQPAARTMRSSDPAAGCRIRMSPAALSIAIRSGRAASPAVLMTAIVLMLGLHPTAMYLYLPALPALQAMLGIDAAQAQHTLAAAVASFGIGQWLWGMPTDRWGRRPVLLAGLAMFLLASIGLMSTREYGLFLACRAAQGLGVAAAGVACRAMLRDLHALNDRVHHLSVAFSWLGVISLLGPPVGAWLYAQAGVQATLAAIAAFGAAALLLVGAKIGETLPSVGLPTAWPPGAWRAMLRHPSFRHYTGLTASSYVGHYLFLAGSSYALIVRLGMSPQRYALVLAGGSLVHMAGTFVCRRWLHRLGLRATLARAAALTLGGGAAMTLLVLLGVHAAWAIIAPQCFYVFGHAIHQSCGQAAVSEHFPERAGTASALSGVLLAVPAALAGWLLAASMEHSDLPMAASMGLCGLATAWIAWRPGQGPLP